ncbi:hypothetical protein K431DRAFT_295572 [Polychaeton citri CBS 116435]|uniref:DUF6987 domain-containing protein n=1 Tax=Polychaeton citri CBS 116435 TaxID=1314669 RepID=A0A9P4Q5E8_9PEZI|nr:hypothetical protein K431DRAFT_295572 [Polychaeton citri CBS 116435]
MAPSPAAGRGAGNVPKTPTKLGKTTQSTPQKLGQSTASARKKPIPQTPKPKAEVPAEASDVAGKATDTAEGAKGQAEGAAGSAQQTAQGAADTAQSQAEGATGGDSDDDEGPMSKVTEAGDNAKDAASGLQEAAPQPIDDDDDAEGTAEGLKGQAEDVADDATEKAGNIGESENNTDAQDDDDSEAGDVTGKAEGLFPGQAKDAAGDVAGKAKGTAEDVAEDAQDTAEDGLDEAQKVAGEATDEAGDAAESAQGQLDDVEDQVDDAKGDVEDEADGATGDIPDQLEGATSRTANLPEGLSLDDLPLDLSILKGLEVNADGTVNNAEGQPIAKLAEGDAEDLEGYPIGDDGEILDDDGDLVGRVELLPDEVKSQLQKAREEGVDLPEGADEYLDNFGEDVEDVGDGLNLPGLSILNGLTCQVDGLIYDDDGNTIGKVVDGDPQELQNATLNEEGEFIDDEGNVVGHAEIHEEAADLVEQGIYEAQDAAEDAQDAAEDAQDVAEDAQETAEDAQDQVDDLQDQVDGIEDELPGIEALEGKELNELGQILDDQGEILGAIEDEELKKKIESGEIDPNDLEIDDEGNVVDAEGNVLSKTELAEGAAEKLAGVVPQVDIRILDGKKINKKGKILDEDGEEIGQVTEGELSKLVGKKVNDKGEVLDKQGNVIGKVGITEGEAAVNATKELLAELGELEPEVEVPQEITPEVAILEGLKVNKKGQILNEDGEPIGELIEGELSDCVGKKVNDQGEVLDKDGNVIGRVKALPQELEDIPEEFQPSEVPDDVEDLADAADAADLPPLSILEGLTVNKSGKIIDANGNVVGELIEGDAKKLSKLGVTADEQGQFWDNKGHVIGKAQTLPAEDAEEEAPFAGLDGLRVVDDGYVEDENGNRVGVVVEGDAKKLIGRVVDEDGDIIDKRGSVVGHAERYEEPEQEEEPEPEAEDLSFLQGKTINKSGFVIGDQGVPIARLVEGKAKELAGRTLDDQGQFWNDRGQVIGRVELIPDEEQDTKPEGPFAGLEGLRVVEGGNIADEDDNIVGVIVEGNAKRLIGLAVDEDGDIVDKYGNVKGHAEPLPEEEEVEIDNSILANKVLNKQGYVVDESGIPYGRLVEGNVKELAGRKCDENGNIYGDTGKIIGRCEVLPENERTVRPEGPFAGLEGLRVVKDGFVEDEDDNRVGIITEGNVKRLIGLAVDEDGDIIDKFGNVKGHADPYEEEEEEEEIPDLTALAGCTVNKAGNVVDSAGAIVGYVTEGDPTTMIGRKVDGQGQIWDNAGNVIGKAGLATGQDTTPEGPFAGFEGLQIQKDETVTTPAGDIVGRIVEGDIKKLLGHTVDEDGDINDKHGNTIGRAERWEPEEKERRINPMSGMRVNKEGEVRDQNGDILGRLTEGDLGHCVGQEIDDSGNVVDVDGNKIGEVTLLENIAEDFEGPTEEELEEARKREEEREIAEKMGTICQQTLERVQPVCKQITEHMEKADRTPKDELDEEELVNQVKPLIEEGGRILQECNGSLRGLDPDGHIAAQAKGRAGTKEATPEEYRLAESLKELTTTVVTTIDNAKKKLNDMPHAKKKLNPLWSLLTQPLFQILAAVGLLLAGVLGLVGQLLNGLGLGGLVNGLLGGLGIDKLMSAFGIGGGSKKKKGGSAVSSLPIVGGMLGGK